MTVSPSQGENGAGNSRDETFPKSRRLCKRREYIAVQSGEIKAHSRGFVGLVLIREDNGPGRLGVTASKRLGNAVMRNAVKRLLREAFRTGRLRTPAGVDVVVIAKRRAADMSSSEVFADLETLGRRIKRLVELNK